MDPMLEQNAVVAKYDGTVWDICGEFNPGRSEITHWQPLPALPEFPERGDKK